MRMNTNPQIEYKINRKLFHKNYLQITLVKHAFACILHFIVFLEDVNSRRTLFDL